jgi:hypothetical protein
MADAPRQYWIDEWSKVAADRFKTVDFAKIESRIYSWQTRQMKSHAFFSMKYRKAFTPVRLKPMFTKQHYEAVAKLLSSQKDDARSSAMTAAERTEQLNTLNETTMRFMNLFKRDNPKFKDLIFIGECDAGVSTEPRKE